MILKELKKQKIILKKTNPVRSGVLASLIAETEKTAKVAKREALQEDVEKAAAMLTKQLQKTVDEVKVGEVVEGYKLEIAELKDFIPETVNRELTTEMIEEVLKEYPEPSMKIMGKVISELKKRYGNKIDMAIASKEVKALLS